MIRKLFAALVAGFSMVCAMAAVNINTATEAQLETLKGIGPAKAKAIIDYRTKNGPFKTVDALKDVKGVGDATFNSIKADVTLSGATTAPAGKPAAPAAKPADAKGAKPADPKAAAPAKADAAKDVKKAEPAKDAKKPEKAASKPAPKADKPAKKDVPKDAPKDGKKKPDEKKQ